MDGSTDSPIASGDTQPDVWTGRIAELVRLAVVVCPVILAILATIKAGLCG